MPATATEFHHDRFAISALLLPLILSSLSSRALAWDKKGTVYTTNGSQQDIKAAIEDAKAGDTVLIPPGTFTCGANGDCIAINKAITLAGSGRKTTTLVLADTSGLWTNAAIRLQGGPVVRDLSITGASTEARAPFAAGGSNGWRITNVEFNQVKSGYFLYVQGAFGLVDHCTINGAAGDSELIFARGPENAWQTEDTIGTADNVYIEDCTFNGQGYVCDINSNGKAVVRFCTITGPIKVDGHGKASNTPPRGVRHMEIYHNTWTSNTPGGWLTVEMRGGTGHLFSNTAARGTFMLRDYATCAQWPNFGGFRTPKDYPIDDQIGTGKDPKVGGSEPLYLWNNHLTTGAPWTRYDSDAAAEARALHGGIPFRDSDLIAHDRDFFSDIQDKRFDGSSGMGMGTRAQMNAIKPTRAKVGFWVTDEGEWNSRNAGPDGRLYIWNGKAWTLKYTPYAYPHPLGARDAQRPG